MRVDRVFDDAVEHWPDRPFLSWDGGQATYAEVSDAVQRQAEILRAAGITAGARIGIALSNRPETIILWLSALRCGALTAFLNPAQTALDLRSVVTALDLAFVATDGRHGVLSFAQVIPRSEWSVDPLIVPFVRPVISTPDEGAAIVLTSGSTSTPKFVEVPHAAYVLKGRLNSERLVHECTDRFLGVMPFFHIGAQCETVMPAMTVGASIHLVEHFSATDFWPLVERRGVTVIHSTASLLLMAFERSRPSPGLPLRVVITSLREDLADQLSADCPQTSLVTLYGLTECPLATLGTLDDWYQPDYVGMPYGSRAEFRFVDADGTEAEEGEIQIRNEACAIRYIGMTDGSLRTEDGWTRTGDLGRWSDHGLMLIGRVKEMIRRSGENIAPAEVETALASHRAVADVVVFGQSDRIRGQEVRALIVLRNGECLSESDLHFYASERLAKFKVPRYIDLCGDFPRTASNKPDKVRIIQEIGAPGWDATLHLRR